MGYKTVDLCCPGCGSPVSTDMDICKCCGRPVVITSFSDVSTMTTIDLSKYQRSYEKLANDNPDNPPVLNSLGICYLVRGNYERAFNTFESSIDSDPDNALSYFFAAVSLLQGKKAFLCARQSIDKAVEYLTTAVSIGEGENLSETGLFYYFLAYIAYDYFSRKHLNINPNFSDYLVQAKLHGVAQGDIDSLHATLKVPAPSELG